MQLSQNMSGEPQSIATNTVQEQLPIAADAEEEVDEGVNDM